MGVPISTKPRRPPGLALAGTLLIAGCATVVSGSSQNVSMVTSPPGANCIFRREGTVIGVINPTPGTLAVSRSRNSIEVRCSKDGYAAASGMVDARFQPVTLGNILLGGVIGGAVDAASGAATQYAPELTLTLTPTVFRRTAERDAFFADRRTRFLAQIRSAREHTVANCHDSDCDRKLSLSREEERAGLARIDAEYQAAGINP